MALTTRISSVELTEKKIAEMKRRVLNRPEDRFCRKDLLLVIDALEESLRVIKILLREKDT